MFVVVKWNRLVSKADWDFELPGIITDSVPFSQTYIEKELTKEMSQSEKLMLFKIRRINMKLIPLE